VSSYIIEFLKKNSWWLGLLLLGVALLLLIYIAVKVPTECHRCMSNPINYYEVIKDTHCVCNNMQFAFG